MKLQRQIESDSEFKRQTEREDVVDRDGNRIDLGGLFSKCIPVLMTDYVD